MLSPENGLGGAQNRSSEWEKWEEVYQYPIALRDDKRFLGLGKRVIISGLDSGTDGTDLFPFVWVAVVHTIRLVARYAGLGFLLDEVSASLLKQRWTPVLHVRLQPSPRLVELCNWTPELVLLYWFWMILCHTTRPRVDQTYPVSSPTRDVPPAWPIVSPQFRFGSHRVISSVV